MTRRTLVRRLKNVYQPAVLLGARLWRRCLGNVTCIGVTGSVGKTSTKDFIHAVLQSRYTGSASFSSTNSSYSAARTLLRTKPWNDYLVQEMGASGPDTLDPILRLVRPKIAVLTHIGRDHYSAFRTEENVAREKAKLIEALPADGIAILNSDDPCLAAMAQEANVRVVTYGCAAPAQIRATDVSADFPEPLSFTVCPGAPDMQPVRVTTQLHGKQMLYPALAALAVGSSLGMSIEEGARALVDVVPEFGRMHSHRTQTGITFIDDSWKASFWTLPAAFEFLAAARASHKWLVLGTVSDHSIKRRNLGRRLIEPGLQSADRVVLIGRYVHYLKPQAGVHAFATVAEADRFLHAELRPGDLVVVKGSHSQDHLARLILSHMQPVTCWTEDCRLDRHCYTCPRLA